MAAMEIIRFVVDTNVVFEGLTKQGSASGILLDAWLVGLFQPCVTDALVYEYADVLTRKLNPSRLQKIYPIFNELLSLAQFIPVYYTWRPIAVDPGDDHIVDCAMNANAPVITWNIRDFRTAKTYLGLTILTPIEAIKLLAVE